MTKRIDITEKLSFDENPMLVIRGEEVEVNSDAPTMLKVMGLMGEDAAGSKEIMQAYEMMFSSAAQKKLGRLKLSFKDLVVVIQEAVQLITGEEDKAGGEQ